MRTNDTSLSATDREHLAKLCGLFSSNHAGERASAAAHADRFLRNRGLRWRDVLIPALPAPQPAPTDVLVDWPVQWREAVQICQTAKDRLRDWDHRFIQTLARYRFPPSDAQLVILRRITDRVLAGNAS